MLMQFVVVVLVLSSFVSCSGPRVPDVPSPRLGGAPATEPEPVQRNTVRAGAELTLNDVEVLRVAIDGFLRSPYGVPYNMAHGGVRMVLPDRTIPVCALPKDSPFSYECISRSDQEAVDRILADQFGSAGPETFRDRNLESSPIRRPIDPQFLLTPATQLLDMLERPWHKEFLRQFPGRQGIVMVSAPTYLDAGHAVVYVLDVVRAAGCVRLAHKDNRWVVSDVRGLWIS